MIDATIGGSNRNANLSGSRGPGVLRTKIAYNV
jgi:hypothetical protein